MKKPFLFLFLILTSLLIVGCSDVGPCKEGEMEVKLCSYKNYICNATCNNLSFDMVINQYKDEFNTDDLYGCTYPTIETAQNCTVSCPEPPYVNSVCLSNDPPNIIIETTGEIKNGNETLTVPEEAKTEFVPVQVYKIGECPCNTTFRNLTFENNTAIQQKLPEKAGTTETFEFCECDE